MSLLSRKRKKKIVLFLCTGDTCRGPMVAGYMKHAMKEVNVTHVEVRTAGVMTIAGLIPQAEAVQVMDHAGVDIRGHRSTPLTPELIRRSDLVLGMTPFHVQHALREAEDGRGKTYLLKEWAESDMKNYQISDPMGATLEVYKRVFREMKLAVDKMIESKDFFKEEPEDERAMYRSARATKQARPLSPVPTAAQAPVKKSSARKPVAKKSAKSPSGSKPAAKSKAPAKPAAKAPAKPAKKAAKAPAAKKKAAPKAAPKKAAKKPAKKSTSKK